MKFHNQVLLAMVVGGVVGAGIDDNGTLAGMAKKFGEEGININYVYGSALPDDEKSLFVFSPEDIDQAAAIFKD